jgi:alkylation response protein AidB-like acyl-CoA dehydrogenase
MAKLLASQASWSAANACVTAFGGYAFAREFDVERKFREGEATRDRARQQQHDPGLHRPANPRHAEVVLTAAQKRLLTSRP